jgi:hypothetical protein
MTYWIGAKADTNWIARSTQMMSIFGAGDRMSDFFSEAFPLATALQSEQG